MVVEILFYRLVYQSRRDEDLKDAFFKNKILQASWCVLWGLSYIDKNIFEGLCMCAHPPFFLAVIWFYRGRKRKLWLEKSISIIWILKGLLLHILTEKTCPKKTYQRVSDIVLWFCMKCSMVKIMIPCY